LGKESLLEIKRPHPKAMFEVSIQAAIGSKIISKSVVKA